MGLALLIVYGCFLAFIFLYSLNQARLTLAYLGKKKTPEQPSPPSEWPFVTVQLPVYNERFVVERLIRSVAAMDYPADKWEIQILDDSTDDTPEVIARVLAALPSGGPDILHIRRENRTGFKAGALQEGLRTARGACIAVFDADFTPDPSFLMETIPHLMKDNRLAFVQTRWSHLNRTDNVLTRLQAFALDAHFSVEQAGRNTIGHFINFNGTAGIWKAEAIGESGGWQSDTLTEDLDLSYRAGLLGYRFLYLEEHETPAELPADINSLKSQQYRWTKGAAECARKHLMTVLFNRNLGLGVKWGACFHLLNSFIFVCVMMTACLSVPLLWLKPALTEFAWAFRMANILIVSLVLLAIYYWTGSAQRMTRKTDFLWQFPLFLCVSMGLSLFNTVAVLEGYVGRKSPFVRTPKVGRSVNRSLAVSGGYISRKISPLTWLEGALALYFVFGLSLAFRVDDFGLFPFHLMLAAGFGFVSFQSIRHALLA